MTPSGGWGRSRGAEVSEALVKVQLAFGGRGSFMMPSLNETQLYHAQLKLSLKIPLREKDGGWSHRLAGEVRSEF